MSEQFGGGKLTDALGSRGESAIFDKASRWVDYSGPTAPGKIEGICVMDHPSNPNHPTCWHARSDGWIGASFNPDSPHGLARDHPLALRYRLLVHSGHADAELLNRGWETYARTSAYEIVPPHQREIASLRRGEISA